MSTIQLNNLFKDFGHLINRAKAQYNLNLSTEFLKQADDQLTPLFITQTGIRPNKNIGILFTDQWGKEMYLSRIDIEDGAVISELNINVYIYHYGFPITIYWKSKSNRDYKVDDIEIDPDDIIFWFGELNPALYLKYLYLHTKLPFKTKDLGFEVVVRSLKVHAEITLVVAQSEVIGNWMSLQTEIYEFIDCFNINSEKKNRRNGVVHNFKARFDGEYMIVLNIDLGSAGVPFYKKLLPFLSQMNKFSKAIID